MAATDTKFGLSVILSLVDRLSAPMNGVQARLKSFDKAFKDKFGKSLKEAGEGIQDIGQKLTLGLTLPLAAAAAIAVKKAVDFEDAFAGVRKTVDATEAQFRVLEQGFKDMALVIPLSTEELMGIGEAAGQLGIKQENILQFSKVMADLAATTNLGSQEAASSLARFANIMQMPISNVDRLGSTIVALGNSSATTEAEIVSMGMRIAAAGKLVGMSEAEVMSMAAAMSSLGIEAEAGGTAFSQSLLRMKKELAKGGEKAGIFSAVAGMKQEEFKALFEKDALGALLKFTGGLKRLDEQGKEVVLILDALGLDGARMTDVLLRAASGTDTVAKALEVGNEAWKINQALVEEANKRYKTMASQLKGLWEQFKQLAASFGEVMVPVLQSFMKAVMPVMKWLAESPTWVKKLIVVLGVAAAAIGPVLIGIGSIAVALAAASIAGMPLMLTIAGITAAIVGLIAAVTALLIYKDDIRGLFRDLKLIWDLKRGNDMSQIEPENKGILEARARARAIEERDRQALAGQKSQAEVTINVKASPGSTATVDKVDASKGADLNINSSAYAGAMGSGG